MPGWQVCLQKGLCENPVGAGALQSSPPAQTCFYSYQKLPGASIQLHCLHIQNNAHLQNMLQMMKWHSGVWQKWDHLDAEKSHKEHFTE